MSKRVIGTLHRRPSPRITRRVVSLLSFALAGCGADPDPSSTTETSATAPEPGETTSSAPPTFNGVFDIIVPPDEDGNLPSALWVGCESGPQFQVSDLEEVVPLVEQDPGGVSEAIEAFLSNGEGQYWPQEDWLILRETEDEILLVHQDIESLSFMTVNRRDGEWEWSGSQSGGPCPLHYLVPDGLNVVDWRLDPDAALDPSGTTLEVLVTERACTSGQEIGDRLVGPQVVMTEDAVRIAFAAEPPPGNAFTCQGIPEAPVTVELPEPLGDHEVIEGLAIGIDLEDYLP